MEKGSLGAKYDDRTNPLDKHMEVSRLFILLDRVVSPCPFLSQPIFASQVMMEGFGYERGPPAAQVRLHFSCLLIYSHQPKAKHLFTDDNCSS